MSVPPEDRDFSWALMVMRNGYAVRRQAWPIQPEGHYAYLHIRDLDFDNWADANIPPGADVEAWCLELVDGKRRTQVTTISAEEVMAYDWERHDAPR